MATPSRQAQELEGESSRGRVKEIPVFLTADGTLQTNDRTSYSNFPTTSDTKPPLVLIPPPEEAVHDSHDAAEAALHRRIREHGFNVSRRRVRYTEGPDRQLWARNYECDRAGAPKNTQHLTEDNRKRGMRGSKCSACPMRIGIRAVSKADTSGPWKVPLTTRSSHHNHLPSRDVRVQAQHRRRAAQEINQPHIANLQGLVELQTLAGVISSTIHATIHNADSDSLVVVKDIFNTKDTVRRRGLASRTAIEALFQELKENNFIYKFQTNKHRLPLQNIVVVTGANTVLPVAQCWLPGEKEGDYVWALNMLRLLMIENDIPSPQVVLTDRELACINVLGKVFPETPYMICRWHMNKNVESMARKHFGQIEVNNPAPGQPKIKNSWQTNSFMAIFFEAVDAETEEEF
ncbi:unnamed protein product [Phytophthora fragariaefolia]|uniref:Unnamed protein product n=1 Tax=Phytophthora fragariaefolia TaxID=1490495 RepID=A0A9W6XZF3_9STRA|nr:unnamed protein product [Phytophthora fragariaefolia]